MDISPEARALHDRAVVVDMHAHPSLKTFLLGEKFHLPHRPPKGMGVFTMQTCLPSLRKGGVNVQVATHYVPEQGLAKDCVVIDGLSRTITKVRRGFRSPNEVTREVIDHFEGAIARAAEQPGGSLPRIVKSNAELDLALSKGEIAVLHAVEGAHSIEGTIANLDDLFDRGVCMLTLAHFYENGVAPPVNAIPHDFFLRRVGCFKEPKDVTKRLTPLGRDVVERILELGMLVDLTHCTPPARNEVIDINAGRRPLLFSHVGLQELASYDINPTAEEVAKVSATGGMVGVILMPYFLSVPKERKSLEPIVATLRGFIQAGGDDCVGIGSDFDGFTEPPKDVHEPAEFPRLTEALLGAFGSATTEKILGANFLRVLKNGWGR